MAALSSPPGRRARRRAETLDHLARTAAALFEANGYDATTMAQVADAADVAKGTLYNHFPTKEAVLAHWVHLTLAVDAPRLRTALDGPGTFRTHLDALFAESARWLEAHRSWLLPYFRHRFLHIDSVPAAEDGAGPRDLSGVFAWLISRAQQEGSVRADLPAEQLAALLHHLYFGALMRWLTGPGRILADEFAAAVDLFVQGAAAPPSPRSRKVRIAP